MLVKEVYVAYSATRLEQMSLVDVYDRIRDDNDEFNLEDFRVWLRLIIAEDDYYKGLLMSRDTRKGA